MLVLLGSVCVLVRPVWVCAGFVMNLSLRMFNLFCANVDMRAQVVVVGTGADQVLTAQDTPGCTKTLHERMDALVNMIQVCVCECLFCGSVRMCQCECVCVFALHVFSACQ